MDTTPMDAGSKEWSVNLRRARERVGISRGELSERSGVPVATLRRWEDGTRRPPAPRLKAVLTALRVPSAEANAILERAGYAPDRTLFPLDEFPDYFYTVDELQDAVEEVPWPEFVLDDAVEVVAANSAVQALWGVDFHEERANRSRVQMNLLSVASDRRFADRVANWDEVVGTLAATLKGRPRESDSLDEPNPYFDAVLAEFAGGDPSFLSRLLDVWASAPARPPKCRWSYRVVWSDPEFGEMRFLAVVSTASEPDALAFSDWHPIDAATWDVLARVKSRWS